ncbi:MAG: threonine synthase [Clostridiales bacterium]|nr:threonine synthase [Clostridiales bacterium]
MHYHSTRSHTHQVSAMQAILDGAAPDGGLYVPARFPAVDLSTFAGLSYAEFAGETLHAFAPDFEKAGIKDALRQAYAAFDRPEVTPLVAVGDSYVLELFHGPTAAFKDIALQALPRLMQQARQRLANNTAYLVLAATSGDTGSAAMSGFADLEGFSVLVYYPSYGISQVQQAQMTRMPGRNLSAVGIFGNFDDAQSAVKAAFLQEAARAGGGISLSSANSINIGRLLPQMVYYIKACQHLRENKALRPGQSVDFVVPTGNFGDILAGYLAKRLGCPIGRLVCASNANRVLTDFLQTGRYDSRRKLLQTLSPSMDILISSNLERLLYYALGEDAGQLAALMAALREGGCYQLDKTALRHIQDSFLGASVDDAQTKAAIHSVFHEHGYLMDPHTATAWQAQSVLPASDNPCVVLATASPFKFPETILTALHQPVPASLEAMWQAISKLAALPLPAALRAVLDWPVRHKDVVDKADILKDIRQRIAP